MDPTIWGPNAWVFIHSIAYTYPKYPTSKEKLDHYNFFISLKHVLPCKLCRKHYTQSLNTGQKLRQALGSQSTLIDWVIELHNEINKSNGKKILKRLEVDDYYKKLYNISTPPPNILSKNMETFILLILLISILIIMRLVVRIYQ